MLSRERDFDGKLRRRGGRERQRRINLINLMGAVPKLCRQRVN